MKCEAGKNVFCHKLLKVTFSEIHIDPYNLKVIQLTEHPSPESYTRYFYFSLNSYDKYDFTFH